MRRWPSLLVCLLLSFTAAFVGSRFLPGPWYAGLAKPGFTPPSWLFAPVWTLLYVLMAVAAWRVWRRRGFDPSLLLWGVQLAANAAWSWLFFGLHRIGWALADIVLLLALVAATMVAFARHDRVAARLMWPYLAWVAFATLLNLALWHLNPGA